MKEPIAHVPLPASRTIGTSIDYVVLSREEGDRIRREAGKLPLHPKSGSGKVTSMIEREDLLRQLYRSLDERWYPEAVAKTVVELTGIQDRPVRRAAEAGGRHNYMPTDFHRPVDMTKQLLIAQEIFGMVVGFAADDVSQIETWLAEAEKTIRKQIGQSDFKSDRLNADQRAKAGMDMSRRQYNKRFRLAARLERRVATLRREQFKRVLTLASKSRLASRISWEDFSSDLNSACFIAYYVARCNVRSLFTNTSQDRPYDEVCDALMKRCENGKANWWAVAHVLPTSEVLAHLGDDQKGVLLADYFNLMVEASILLRDLWSENEFSHNMVVRPGNDSTTWNVTAGAWNKLRQGWFSLLYDMGLEDVVERMCPGKVLRLIAADVAFWHKSSGGDVHADTDIWKELPKPWEVLAGAECPKSLVDRACKLHKMDPTKSGWSAPDPTRRIEKFKPTPNLVHGVVVASPALAAVLKKAGVFSGKEVTGEVAYATVEEIRQRHRMTQEEKRAEKEQGIA